MAAKGSSYNALAANPNAKLDEETVREIWEARRRYQRLRLPKGHPSSIDVLAARYGISRSHVSRIGSRQQWADVLKNQEPMGDET